MVDQSIFYQPDQRVLLNELIDEWPFRARTEEAALSRLREAGILDKSGEFTAPYSNLGRIVNKLSPKA
jgi:hypothetical protein